MTTNVKWHKYKEHCNQVKKYKESKYTKCITGAGNEIAEIENGAGDSFLPGESFFS